MKKLESKIDVKELWKKIANSAIHFHRDDSGVLMCNNQVGSMPATICNICTEPIAELRELLGGRRCVNIMINVLPTDVFVPVHTDNVHVERWHLPITTSHHAYFWGEDIGIVTMPEGFWYNINQRVRHTIGNYGPSRMHLVLDFERVSDG